MLNRFAFGTEYGFFIATTHAVVAFLTLSLYGIRLSLLEWAFVFSIPAITTLILSVACVLLPPLTLGERLMKAHSLTLPFSFSILMLAVIQLTTTTSYAVAAPAPIQNYFVLWANPAILGISFFFATIWLKLVINWKEGRQKRDKDLTPLG